MKKKQKCYLCGKPGLEWSKKSVEARLEDGRKTSLPAVFHEYCPNCGERFYVPGSLTNHRKQKLSLRTG